MSDQYLRGSARYVTEKNRSGSVSIGMPVFNGAKYIREALDSLLAQTFTDFELIISDNASTDGTEAICREHAEKDPRIRYVRQGENRGAEANFQFVLNEAKGQYFMWAAHDDRWSKDWIKNLRTLLMIDHGVGAAFGRIQTINEESKAIFHQANNRRFDFYGTRGGRRLRYFVQPESLGKANPIYSLFRRDVINKLNLEEYSFDCAFLFSFLWYSTIKSTNSVVLFKRVHNDCTGGGAVAKQHSSLFKRIINIVLAGLGAKVNSYWRYLSKMEKCLIILVAPIKAVLIYTYSVLNIIRKMNRCS